MIGPFCIKNNSFTKNEDNLFLLKINLCNGLIKIAALNFAFTLFFKLLPYFYQTENALIIYPLFILNAIMAIIINRQIYEAMVIYDIMGHQISLF